jgi:hypothetical protein
VSGTSGGQGQSGLGGSNGERSAAAGRGGHRATTDEQRLRELYEQSEKLFAKEFYSKDKLKQDQLALEQAVGHF